MDYGHYDPLFTITPYKFWIHKDPGPLQTVQVTLDFLLL